MKICLKPHCNNVAIPRGKYCEEHRTNRRKTLQQINPRNYDEINDVATFSPPSESKGMEDVNEMFQRSLTFNNNNGVYQNDFEEAIRRSLECYYESHPKSPRPQPSQPDAELLESRRILEEQQIEYEETMKKDLETLRKKEEEDLAKIRKQMELLRKQKEEKLNQEIKKLDIENKRQRIAEMTGSGYKIRFTLPNGQKIIITFSDQAVIQDLYDYIIVYLHDNKFAIHNFELFIYPRQLLSERHVVLSESNLAKNLSIYVQDMDT